MKRFVNSSRRQKPAPRIITTSYRLVAKAEAQAAAGCGSAAPEPLKPANSFSELAARAYGQSRSSGVEMKINAVA